MKLIRFGEAGKEKPGVIVDVYLPTGKAESIKESGVLILTTPDKIKVKTYDSNYVTVEIGSGKYNFSGKL